MTVSAECGRELYRLLVTRHDASEILFARDASRISVPSLTVLRSERIVGQLSRMVLRNWKLQTCCLWIERSDPCDPKELHGCAVMDVFGAPVEPPQGMEWVSLGALHRREDCCDPGTIEIVQKAIARLRSFDVEGRYHRFARPGWIRQLFDWIEPLIQDLGYRVTGEFTQLNGDPGSCLIRFETTGPAMWFKAVGAPKQQELQVTSSLAKLFPIALPPIVAIHQDWNGWLTQNVSGTSLDQIDDITTWERVAATLARLQIASIDARSDLLAQGCRDASLPTLTKHVGPFFDRLADYLDGQTSEVSRIRESTDVAFLVGALDESCDRLQEIGLPDAIAHLDLNFGNVICSKDACTFLDWAEAAISTPLTSFEYLRELGKRSRTRGYGTSVRVNAAYLRPWHAIVSPGKVAKALAYSPLIAVFTFALACDRWGEQPSGMNLAQTRTLHSLTLRMYREALRLRNSPCAA